MESTTGWSYTTVPLGTLQIITDVIKALQITACIVILTLEKDPKTLRIGQTKHSTSPGILLQHTDLFSYCINLSPLPAGFGGLTLMNFDSSHQQMLGRKAFKGQTQCYIAFRIACQPPAAHDLATHWARGCTHSTVFNNPWRTYCPRFPNGLCTHHLVSPDDLPSFQEGQD